MAILSTMNLATENRVFHDVAGAEARGTLSTSGQGTLPWLAAVEWFAVALLATVFVWHSLVPAWQSLRSEFPDYYLAAELYHRGIPLDRVYEWTWFQRQNDHLGVRDGLVSFAPNPPTSILPLLALTRLQPLAAKRVWLVASLGFLALSIFFLQCTTALPWRRLVLIAVLCVLPLSDDFLFGRPYVFLLFLICAAYYAASRSHHRTSGLLWSGAAAMKLFPAIAVILFLRRRNWRALAGFLLGAITLVAVSIAVFGSEVHRVFFSEVLSQASRGDWLGPYALSQNSFITLWSHLFLVEPELNPSPWINSPALYAGAQAATTTVLVLSFLRSIVHEETPRAAALQWAAVIPLMLLLSTTTAPDHSCLLIFSAIIGVDVLIARGNNASALTLLLLYAVACAPIPNRILNVFPLFRLVATTLIYGLLVHHASARRTVASLTPAKFRRLWLAAGVGLAALLTVYNLHALRSREEDFSRRLPAGRDGFRFANPAPVEDGVAFTEMQPAKYGVKLLTNGGLRDLPLTGDALAVTGSAASAVFYCELTGRKSYIVRLEAAPGSSPQVVAEGQELVLSPNGKWLAFIREEQDGRGAVYLMATDSTVPDRLVLPSAGRPLDITVTDDGDVIAAAGDVSDPRLLQIKLLQVKRTSGEITSLAAFPHPARYPSISPDGKRLAFSRRDRGSWHLMVRTLATGRDEQLTHASCNAISPSWANNQTLLYATDCGRGVGMSAIARAALLAR